MSAQGLASVRQQLREAAKSSSPRTPAAVDDAKVSVDTSDSSNSKRKPSQSQRERELASAALAEQVERLRPELRPLLGELGGRASPAGRAWRLERAADAVRLSAALQDRLLCLPELNRSSPCYSARGLVLLYTKLQYLATFSPADVAAYARSGDGDGDGDGKPEDEEQLMLQLPTVASNAELFSRLAALLRIPSHGDQWSEIAKFVACALPFAEQAESLLARGSDDRSLVCPRARTNKYYTTTVPGGFDVARGSCTCSGMTHEAFARCEKLRQELLLNALSINPNAQSATDFFDAKMRAVRSRIADCIGVRELVDDDALRIALTPSGTDAELVATSAALSRLFAGLAPCARSSSSAAARDVATRKVTSIIVAKGEIGRGSASASGGRHFSSLTPSGEAGTPGDALRRFPTDLVDVEEISGRDDSGKLVSIDEKVYKRVTEILGVEDSAVDPEEADQNVVLLHVVLGAKTGFCCPSLDIVDRLAQKHPNRLLVVIDACQMRLDRDMYRDFVSRGYVVLLTGSKFFAGAPFCGAVLLPMRCVYEMETAAVETAYVEQCHPLGLEDYFSLYDFPECMKHVRARMGTNLNVGLLLRWESALTNMEPFFKIPQHSMRRAVSSYMNQCKANLRSNWSHIVSALENEPETLLADTAENSDSRGRPLDSIVSFKVIDTRSPHSNESQPRFLDAAALRDLHMLVAKDLSEVLPNDPAAKLRCMLGQPVPLGKTPEAGAVLRIAVGADMVNYMYSKRDSGDGVADLIRDDERILSKLELILENWDALHQQFVEEKVEASPLKVPSPLSDWNFGVKKPAIARVVQHMCREGVLASSLSTTATADIEDADLPLPPQKLAVVYDLDAIDMAFQSLLTSFPAHFEHRFAMKSCPLSFFVRRAIDNDVGMECASVVEVMHALRLGCPAHRIVFDSPCKTEEDIAFALNAGVEVNADNFDELAIIRAHAEAMFQSNFPECTPRFAGHLPRIGLRVNPLLGAGSNECLSVSTAHSKFGVPLTPANRAKIIGFFCENPWMQGLHCHVGSQGCTLEMLAKGATIISELAEQIDSAAGAPRVKVLNIGGGLPSNYDSDDVAPTFASYVDVLRRDAPHLFERKGRTILTEFGRSVSAKTGWTISQVEYVKSHEDVNAMMEDATGSNPVQTAIIHAGSDLFLRTCYRPDLFPHRLSVFT